MFPYKRHFFSRDKAERALDLRLMIGLSTAWLHWRHPLLVMSSTGWEEKDYEKEEQQKV